MFLCFCASVLYNINFFLIFYKFRSTWGSFENFKKDATTTPTKDFPKTLQDFIQQKQWERYDVETEQKRVRTAHTQKLKAERYAKKYGIDPKKHLQRMFPKSHSTSELKSLPHHTPPKHVRMAKMHVPPITRLKYVYLFFIFFFKKLN